MPGTPGSKQIYALTWGPRARMPGTPGGQQMYTIMGGPGAPYAREPGKSTNTRTYVGPGGPYARDRGKSTTIHNYVGPGAPYTTKPREVNRYAQLCGAWEPRSPGTPGGQQIYTIVWGLGSPYTRDPGRSTNIHNI